MTTFFVLERAQTAALLAFCLLCVIFPHGLMQQSPFHPPVVFSRSRRFSAPISSSAPLGLSPSIHSLPGIMFLSADAATTEGNVTLKHEVVLCLSSELFFAVALWAARHVNSTWPAVPAYPGNRTELGFRMDVPIRVKSTPLQNELADDRHIRWFAANGTDCDVLVGPGESSAAIGISKFVKERQIWIDPDSFSSTLSNKTLYPAFSRIVPPWSELVRPTVRFLNALDISHVIVVCDQSAGLWFATQFIDMWRTLNPDSSDDSLLSTECLNTDRRDTTLLDRVIAVIASSRIRTVFVATYIWDSKEFLRRLNATRPDLVKERVFVFSLIHPCGPLPLPGVLCFSPSIPAGALPEYSNRSALSQAEDLAYYASLGVPFDRLNASDVMTVVRTYRGVIYDATVFALTAMSKYRALASAGRVPLVNGTKVTPTEYARLVTVPNGLTGELSLTSTGDRRHIRTYIHNSDTENPTRTIGYLDSGVHFNTADLYLAGRMGVVPSALLPVAPASRISAAAIAAMCVMAVLLVTVTVGCGAYFFRVGKVFAEPAPSAVTGAPEQEVPEEEGVDEDSDGSELDVQEDWGDWGVRASRA